ncbi:histidinol dehydrogenase [Blochmannia endosymbiont of Camponotus (Colobopsis) obliquus]|uniref:histidinol dehydrogenase n=1 Tax=Blochmannia endosymbiont of Camponotus (Colobopsis) obliquus TaxID=1505597 RepID=UPI00061A5385|nr:histidinol dehydrogenase [Blochmannia endosymbiont of Camponotus (Colobopsis) obliquus]AKC60615.1 histidinol dehydrogenase [Blochmannia endosymbiont of Camponotus (Colobopsis) obliquus]
MKNNSFPEIIFWHKCCNKKKTTLLTRPSIINTKHITIDVQNILKKVELNGDSALKSLTLQFDHTEIKQFRVTHTTIKQAQNKISKKFKEEIKIAKKNITVFHQAQKIPAINVTTSPGVLCQQITLPLNAVGLYIPGKSAPLVSTVLMLAVPALIAGCKRTIICSPPPIADEILYAAYLCNIKEIYQIGGVQAIAAMGFGTESIAKVNKIFGPGNAWVTEAKKQISQKINGPTIDLLAGPSELIIIADNKANPKFIAADLLSQAEHGHDSQVILLTPSIELAKKVKKEIKKQILNLSRNKIIKKSLVNSSLIITSDLKECISISNQYGPEHLIIQTQYPRSLINFITNVGSIFLGDWSPESAGDYASGTNHILPTYGCTLTNSGLSLIDFQKRITIQQLSKEGLLNLAPTIQTLAKAEGLTAHEHAVTLRTTIFKENNEN